MILKRGPQSMQCVNGYKYLLSSGSNTSLRQDGHVLTSAGMMVSGVPMRLPSISNECFVVDIRSISSSCILSIRVLGGFSFLVMTQNHKPYPVFLVSQ